MSEQKQNEQTFLPGIIPAEGENVSEIKETKSQENVVPEVTVKFAQHDDGLDEKCAACGDAPGGCPQCGFGRGKK